mmetsp:Transcript_1521/g.2433  ORF Transcript_1521/g.2433 Transcript_1521/m.2433 type:complete len:202 (+) Transcript_1521:1305-1910(+)
MMIPKHRHMLVVARTKVRTKDYVIQSGYRPVQVWHAAEMSMIENSSIRIDDVPRNQSSCSTRKERIDEQNGRHGGWILILRMMILARIHGCALAKVRIIRCSFQKLKHESRNEAQPRDNLHTTMCQGQKHGPNYSTTSIITNNSTTTTAEEYKVPNQAPTSREDEQTDPDNQLRNVPHICIRTPQIHAIQNEYHDAQHRMQ